MLPTEAVAETMSAHAANGMVEREALEDAFREWWSLNSSAMELGGTGDVHDLLLRLIAARAKS
ncbi:MAG: hypothetical protein Q8R92_05600 [Deltaproteobacteria bacterium]|nr:hypothetical protein [Deltaproteobacteria bacterium]